MTNVKKIYHVGRLMKLLNININYKNSLTLSVLKKKPKQNMLIFLIKKTNEHMPGVPDKFEHMCTRKCLSEYSW